MRHTPAVRARPLEQRRKALPGVGPRSAPVECPAPRTAPRGGGIFPFGEQRWQPLWGLGKLNKVLRMPAG